MALWTHTIQLLVEGTKNLSAFSAVSIRGSN